MSRIQFEVSAERLEEIDSLKERTGLTTRAQLLNAAFTLFEWAVRERENNRIIASMDEKLGKYKEVDMPGLPAIQYDEETEPAFSSLMDALRSRVETAAEARAYIALAQAFSFDDTEKVEWGVPNFEAELRRGYPVPLEKYYSPFEYYNSYFNYGPITERLSKSSPEPSLRGRLAGLFRQKGEERRKWLVRLPDPKSESE